MDDPALGLEETERALTDLDRVTRWSGGLLPAVRALQLRLAGGPRRQRLLDLGTGSGLVPSRLAAVAARSGVELRTVGCDRKLSHLLHGRRRGHRQQRVVASVEALPFADGAFDWSLSTARDALEQAQAEHNVVQKHKDRWSAVQKKAHEKKRDEENEG